MAALFISDLHIDASRPAILAQFLEFLRVEAQGAEALYILGDLFESWVGDDAPDAAQAAATAGLAALTGGGVPCFVMHGNRDFLLAGQFASASGASLLPDPVIVTLYGTQVLVMHGDALCTDDHAYQRLRAATRDGDWQRRFLSLPIDARRAIAGAARAGSKAHTVALAETITDVNAAAVEAAFKGAGVDILLHGHTHRPAVHTLQIDGRPHSRIVLGDWYHQGSVLRWDHEGPQLKSLYREAVLE